MKAVDFGVFGREIHDVSVDHPFSDGAWWKQLWGDTQRRQNVWVGKASPNHDFLEQALPRVIRGAHHVRQLGKATNLLDLGLLLGCMGAERSNAHAIPHVETFPYIREPSGSECYVALFRDVL